MACKSAEGNGKASARLERIEAKAVRLLLVEDRLGGLERLAEHLRGQAGMRIDAISDSGLLAGVRAIFDTPDVVLVSADLVGFSAWDTVRLVKQLTPAVSVLVIGRVSGPWEGLRPSECPDAIVEQTDDFAVIVGLIRALRARRGAGTQRPALHARPGSCAPDAD
jgi:hypothetical protein